MIRRLYERWILNPKAQVISELMRDDPEKWFGRRNMIDGCFHTLHCGDMQIWVGNGWWFVEIHRPVEEKLGLVGRTLVWRQAKKILRRVKNQPQGGKYKSNEAALQGIAGRKQ